MDSSLSRANAQREEHVKVVRVSLRELGTSRASRTGLARAQHVFGREMRVAPAFVDDPERLAYNLPPPSGRGVAQPG